MPKNDRLAPGSRRDGIVGLEAVPADEVDVVVDLVGKNEEALVGVFHRKKNRSLREAEALGEMHKLGLLAENLGKFGIINFKRQLGILSLGIGRVFLVGEVQDFRLLGGSREGLKKGDAGKDRESGCPSKENGCWHVWSLGQPFFGTRFFIQQKGHQAKPSHFQIVLDDTERRA
jgi:hypothetical protein